MTLTVQFATMLSMVLSGVFIGASYHTFKRIEKPWFHHIFWRYGAEILFWLLHAILLYYILYIVNEGILRFYVFLSVFCGYAMFKSLFEGVYKRLLDILLHLLRRIYDMIYKVINFSIIQPIVWIISIVLLLLSKIATFILSILLLCWKVITWPIKWIILQLIKLLPKNAQKYLHHFYSKYSKIIKKDQS